VNKKAVESSIAIGLALGCEIAPNGRFARKNYFYPDLAKNFQTSQYDEPIAFEGKLDVEISDGQVFEVLIERAHMEEDAGKLTHVGGATGRIQGAEYSLVDFNRAGVPLVEIVTKPVFGAGSNAPELAAAYVRNIRDIVKAMDVSDAKMERGNVRCDANVSLRPNGQEKLGTRTETKNVNSIRSVENDYRYFPEPDLVPVQPANSWIEEIRVSLPENPQQRRKRLANDWGFSELEFRDVVNGDLLDLVEATVAAGTSPQAARKWWTGELSRQANAMELSTSELAISPDQVATIQKLIDAGDLTDRMAREVVAGVIAGEGTPEQVIEKRGLKVVTDEGALIAAIDEALKQQPDVLEKIREGKVQAAGAVIGAVMKAMGGQVDAARVRELILERAGS
jgi:aspartyl-tRNA(Asn)/glutamyl-tRNA(Gln) amidotransferase subunit B